ncbi:M16 family metallopeptidase [Undibacterium sp. TJN19]|uniref:M16 family metallopeptidase n=1 Tax=Undibacterium sp. TJN19 TaxID=3413055 RepID=UPI003BF06E6C
MPAFKTTLRFAFFTASLLLSNSPTQAATSIPANMEKMSTVEGITEYHLANGLKILLMPDNSQATITVNMTYLLGSKHENTGQTGYAHLLEHMLCKGSKNYPQITSQLSARGMRWNAYTHLDFTNYFESFEASDTDLEWVLGMEADRMQNANVLQRELDTEMTVVRNELELRNGEAHSILLKRVQAVAFDWHGYGHSVIGEKSDIENVNVEQLRHLYATYYRPDNAVLLVAGKFDPSKALSWISKKFGSLATPKTSIPKIPTIEPAQQGERQVVVRQKSNFNVNILAYHRPSALHPDYSALKIAGAMLASGREQRDKDNQIFIHNVSPGFQMQGNADAGLAIFSTDNTINNGSEESVKGLIKIVESFSDNSLAQSELDYMKSGYVNNFSKLMNDTEKLGIALSEYIALGDWRLLFVEKDRIAHLTTLQVQNAAKHYFVRENRTAGILISEEKSQNTSIPATPALNEVMQNFAHVDEYAPVEDFNASVSNIQARTRRIKLGNIDVALLPKPGRGQAVSVDVALHWGDEKSLFAKRWLERITDLAMLNGANQYGKEALEAEREKLHIQGGLTQFTTDRSHLKQALQLMVLNLKEPSFAQASTILDKEKKKWSLERSNPIQMAMDQFAQHFNAYPAGDIRAQETTQQIISELYAIKPIDLFDFHKQFYGASNGHIAIVGDFDVDEVIATLSKELSGWESKAPYEPAHRKILERMPLNTFLETPGKENAYFFGRIDLAVSKSDDDFAALEVANYLIGGTPIDSRLGRRVRQKEGWTYNVNSKIDGSTVDPVSSWQIMASAAVANVDKLKKAIQEELQLVEASGFQQEELDKAKSAMAHLYQQQRASDSRLAYQWSMVMHVHQDFSWFARREAAIQNLTLAQLNQITKKYLQPGLWSIVTTGDSKKIPKK